jgi:hypothetical protein
VKAKRKKSAGSTYMRDAHRELRVFISICVLARNRIGARS